jgi:hypothetical protein
MTAQQRLVWNEHGADFSEDDTPLLGYGLNKKILGG